METYRIQIGDCVRQLPICPINENLSIAGFVMLGDVELTEACAKELLKICPEHDIIVTAETKGITLAHEMARIGCGDYIVARKGIKAYMQNPVSVEVKSITTEDVQKLYLAKADYDKLKDKRVLIVDDVISTGESLAAIQRLLSQFSVNIVGSAAVLAKGDAADRDDIIFVQKLPLFFHS